MLKVQKLSKKFDQKIAVDEVSFDIAPGEIFSLIGPNSSGKTTIIKSIIGMLSIDNGQIRVDGGDVAKDPIRAQQMIGYIPDEPSVWSGMTGEEFLHVVGALYNIDPKKREKRIRELLPLFSLEGIEKDEFEHYSRGNKQKFSILSALLHHPKLLLIDEPIVGLDPESATIAKRLFKEFASGGGAVLLVTHTLAVADEISSRIGVLAKGKLVAASDPASLRREAKLGTAASLEDVYRALT